MPFLLLPNYPPTNEYGSYRFGTMEASRSSSDTRQVRCACYVGVQPSSLFGRWVLCLLLGFALSPAARATTATSITLSGSANSITRSTAFTLTATVTASSTPVSPGSIVFCDTRFARCQDNAIVGRAQLLGTGVATLKFFPGLGTHTYRAIFNGTTTYTTSTSATVSVTVTGTMSATATLTSSGAAGNYGLTGTVVSVGPLTPGPTGSVSFRDATNSNYVLGTATLGSVTTAETFPGTAAGSVTSARQGCVADFNGDGVPDMAVASQTSNGVVVMLGSGSGGFTNTSASPIATGTTPVGVVATDLNNDGKMDLVVTNYGASTISILLGNGDGTFQTAVTKSVAAQPEAILAADFNHDGNMDLVVAHLSTNTVAIMLGDGSGGFPTSISVATGSGPYSLAVADLNGDGNLDVVAGNSTASTVTLLLGDGTGNFTPASGSPLTAGSDPSSVLLSDFNSDGKVDLVVANGNATSISYFSGNGDGTFTSGTTLTAATGLKYLASLDANDDGKLDLVSAEYSGNISFYPGNGDGTFATRVASSSGGSSLTYLLSADFDGDGVADIAVPVQSVSLVGIGLGHVTHTATASISGVSIPGSGSHSINVSYAGDTNDAIATSSNVALTASKVATSLTLQTAPTSSNYGQQVVLTASLTPYVEGAETTNTETITFLNNGSSIGTGTLSNGVATLMLTSLPLGSDSLSASYAGDTNFITSTSSATVFTVSKGTPTITWTNPAAIAYGTPLSSTQLNASSGGVAGTFAYTPASGTILNVGANQTLSVIFSPTDSTDYNSAPATVTITVNQAAGSVLLATSSTPSAYATPVTFTATMPSNATGTVTFKDGATILGTASIVSNSAAIMTSALSVGTHSITASWPGDTNYTSAVSTALSQTVNRASVTITATSSLNPSLYGDSVTLTYTFTGGGATPTGTATLVDGSTTLGTLTLSAGGVVNYPSANLVAGTHSLKITYNGDTNYK